MSFLSRTTKEEKGEVVPERTVSSHGPLDIRFSHMLLSSVLFIGWRNMFANRMRSILTVGGVAIGIGIITDRKSVV